MSTADHVTPVAPEAPVPPPGRRVVIAVDDTPAARTTLASGLAHAAAQDAEAVVVHVVPARAWRVARMAPCHTVPLRARDPQASPVLREARRLAFGNGVRARVELIASDDPDAVLAGVARREGADSIVVGVRRPEALAAPFGGVRGLLRAAGVPVVVVPA